jgi:hypothetical protein
VSQFFLKLATEGMKISTSTTITKATVSSRSLADRPSAKPRLARENTPSRPCGVSGVELEGTSVSKA